jgi:hypothetical protein
MISSSVHAQLSLAVMLAIASVRCRMHVSAVLACNCTVRLTMLAAWLLNGDQDVVQVLRRLRESDWCCARLRVSLHTNDRRRRICIMCNGIHTTPSVDEGGLHKQGQRYSKHVAIPERMRSISYDEQHGHTEGDCSSSSQRAWTRPRPSRGAPGWILLSSLPPALQGHQVSQHCGEQVQLS